MAGVEQYLETGRRLGRGKLASYLGVKPEQFGEGICLAVTAAYLVQATTLSGRLETPLTALDNLGIKLPFIRSGLLEEQETWEDLIQNQYDNCMSRALGKLYQMLIGTQQTAAIDPHHVAESAGYAGMTGGIRNVVSGSMVFNPANPVQLAMMVYRCQNGRAHAVSCARNGSSYYLFDCDYGIFVLQDDIFDTFIQDYHRVQDIKEAMIGSVVRI